MMLERKDQLLLVGAGAISEHYIKVLQALDLTFSVVSRGEENARKLADKTGVNVISGGVDQYFKLHGNIPEYAIVATGIESITEVTTRLLARGIRKILIEKPGSLYMNDLAVLERERLKLGNANVVIGFNRRFYGSVFTGNQLILEDGGIQLMNFEFTEWSHQLENKIKAPGIMEHWFLANSIHVVDLAFHIAGTPREINCHTRGTSNWHPSAMQFTGSGVTVNDIPFAYFADWQSAGRWSVEVTTSKRKIIFRPLEKLQVQNRGSLDLLEMTLPVDEPDLKYKPGFYRMIDSFIHDNLSNHCTLAEMIENFPLYHKMANYKL